MNYTDLDLNLVKVFISVYENKSILSASKKLFVSQPAVTNSIKKLESFLGGELFVRVPKGVLPTSEGEQFYQSCKDSLYSIDNAIKNFSMFSSLEKGSLNIGSSSTIIRRLLMPFITEFSKKYPNVIIRVTDAISVQLLKYLKRGEIDIAIMNTPIDNDHLFNETEITTTNDCFIAPFNFEHDYLDKEELKNFHLILQKRPSNNRDYFEQMCIENNIDLKPNYEIGSFGLITDFVENGMGIAFTIKDFIKKDIAKNKVKELKTNFVIAPRKVVVLSEKNSVNSFACKTFVNELVEHFKMNAPVIEQ